MPKERKSTMRSTAACLNDGMTIESIGFCAKLGQVVLAIITRKSHGKLQSSFAIITAEFNHRTTEPTQK
jgi:hypothetical protein